MPNLKDNFCLNSSHEMRDICRPLFEHSSVEFIAYGRFYKDNSLLVLESKAGYAGWYIQTKQYQVARAAINPRERRLPKGYCFSDTLDLSHPKARSLANQQHTIFSHFHNVFMVDSHPDYNEVMDFKTYNKNSLHNEWCASNIDVLEKFVAYFKEKAAPLLKQAENNRIFLPDAEKNIGAARSDLDAHLVTLDDTTRSKVNFQYEKLTQREKECTYWLFCGKTVPEIALLLNISKRTVEKFIAKLKDNFNCNTLFQLGNSLTIIKDKLLLMEKLRID
jgi:DNA-binding CsgD family transcriptional regulator